ncbi:HNH endonuclease [Actinoallomurus purpureus]|uniref:HNH endonuclease n=1 Tax=Actinoallomurus purpureus TaxID=478114 RepID=UPI0020939BEE|nr:HNH endonuclease [Actinoallomurus purpureus]MCO6006512.1 HNH endonuclease [Actinoallomurus purpureus]
MIPIMRHPLDDGLGSRLSARTTALKANAHSPEAARRAWKSASAERQGLRERLNRMAAGIMRCMYCGDNLGTDIDHFEPISRAPLRTFEWPNHLLACSFCNSNQKRDTYPCDPQGTPLLIDPSTEDPNEHLRLALATGEYRHLTAKGEVTIQVFGLNRADLVRGRAGAFHTRRAVLCHARSLLYGDRKDEADRCLRALAEEPHASVLHAMLRSVDLPGAVVVLGADVVAALRDPKILDLLSLT